MFSEKIVDVPFEIEPTELERSGRVFIVPENEEDEQRFVYGPALSKVLEAVRTGAKGSVSADVVGSLMQEVRDLWTLENSQMAKMLDIGTSTVNKYMTRPGDAMCMFTIPCLGRLTKVVIRGRQLLLNGPRGKVYAADFLPELLLR